ncbi:MULTISPECIES: DUF190 domain-containing protein [unclassified Methylophaga]|uniref:DUF190 domain-containing protein n=1 Tax=unclassified Methylophaga TaxID=2629249 RepID=UPI00259C84B9|nr:MULTISPECIES: DUF190 domain-containing protein [unclassified Methylophaga]|tara:strand:+ start:6884 stop:7186 length:303 start_codon:yes stop_codon:yes gene_type:complete
MSRIDVTMVRVYLAEGRDHGDSVIKLLESSDIKGFTVFRGIAGLGAEHQLHKASLLDLSPELPLVVEFFDSPQKVEKIITQLESMVKPDHIVSWTAQSGK